MRIAALWSPKVRRALRGRTDWRGPVSRIKRAEPGAFRIHFHAASVGEFEQAKPLIRALREEGGRYHITASFFSPSGFEGQKDYPLIDGACYIPHDRQGEMSEFMNRITPDLIVIIRYDLWLEFMRQAQLRSIPVVLACGVLRSDSIRFFFGLRRFFSSLYGRLALIHCVSEEDREAFNRLAPDVPVHVSGDTRYDRVRERLRDKKKEGKGEEIDMLLRAVAGERKILVAGSTWPEDENLLASLRERTDLFLVIVPHEPQPSAVEALLQQFPGSVLFSQIQSESLDRAAEREKLHAVIIDRMGILAELYALADIGYVGGGFGAGVHSLLEPAAYGVPTFSGPRIERSRDACALRDAGLLGVVSTAQELVAGVESLLQDDVLRTHVAERTLHFVEERLGATDRILRGLRRDGLLPSSTLPHVDPVISR